MDIINERFRILREACDKTQTEWASILGLSRSGVTAIESGQRSVTEKHIKLLTVHPVDGRQISETWLRTGEGEMFVPLTRNQIITDFAADLIREEDGDFKKRLIEALALLDEKEWDVLEGLAKKLAEEGKD